MNHHRRSRENSEWRKALRRLKGRHRPQGRCIICRLNAGKRRHPKHDA